jgi:hypothetical protein
MLLRSTIYVSVRTSISFSYEHRYYDHYLSSFHGIRYEHCATEGHPVFVRFHENSGSANTWVYSVIGSCKGRKTDRGENYIMMKFITCILHLILLGRLNQGGWGGRDMWHVWGRLEMFKEFWLGGPNGRDHWKDLGVGGMITLSWTLGR